MNRAVSGYETIAVDDLAVHSEIAASMPDQLVEFFEGPLVEQQIDALTRRKFAFGVLLFAAVGPASGFG